MSTVIRGQQGGSTGNAVEGGGFCFASTTYSEGCSKGPLDAALLENGTNITEGCTAGPLDLGFLDNGVNAECGNDSADQVALMLPLFRQQAHTETPTLEQATLPA